VAAQDWVSQWDAMDIGRRLRPELSDEVLWQMLGDAAGPPPEAVSLEGSDQKIRCPRGRWPVRTRWPTIYVRHYFVPDVERLYLTKSTSSSKPAERATVPDRQDNIDSALAAAANTLSTATPAPVSVEAPKVDPFRTGAAGRPTGLDLVLLEAARRIREGEIKPRHGGRQSFADSLRDWWDIERMKYDPPGPKLTAKTIYDRLGSLWNEAIRNS
jgi:hypothetical protein